MSIVINNKSSCTRFESVIKVEELVQTAKSYGMMAVGLCDRNNVYQLPKFHEECKKQGIKPIHGIEIDVEVDGKQIPLLVVPRNNAGMRNVFALASFVNDGMHEVCNVEDVFAFCKECYLFLLGNTQTFTVEELDDVEMLKKALRRYKAALSSFLLGLEQATDVYLQAFQTNLKEACKEVGIDTVALPSSTVLEEEDANGLLALKAIQEGKLWKDVQHQHIVPKVFLNPSQMQELYAIEDLKRIEEIVASIDVTIPPAVTSLPVYQNPKMQGSTPAEFLVQLARTGLCYRLNVSSYEQVPSSYAKRLDYELKMIIDLQFESYFLTVYDILRYAASHKIAVAPGRGSCVGSLVCYVIGITQIDPIAFDLSFERFLNPARTTMPDIDIDIAKDRVEEVREYVCHSFGNEHSARIVVFTHYGPKGALDKACKLFEISDGMVRQIRRYLYDDVSLKEQFETNLNLRSFILRNQNRNLYDMYRIAMALDGCVDGLRVHEPGIVVSKDPIWSIIPGSMIDYKGQQAKMHVTQFDKNFIEQFGFIKFDVLSAKPPMQMQQMEQLIQMRHKEFALNQIPLNDERTIKAFATRDVSYIPQADTISAKIILQNLQPRTFHDLVAFMALNRPGAGADFAKEYARNRAKGSFTCIHPCLEPILKETYGVILYQEQVMRIGMVAANLSVYEADELRAAISKKNYDKMKHLEQRFLDGCVANNMTLDDAKAIFKVMMRFASYGFNKSHAVAYALTSYRMQYLRVHYPCEFYKVMLEGMRFEKEGESIEELLKHGIVVYPVDVNESCKELEIYQDGVILPFAVVKDSHAIKVDALIEERRKKPFASFYDFVMRMHPKGYLAKDIENLIDAGAFDCFENDRGMLYRNVESLCRFASVYQGEDEDLSENERYYFKMAEKQPFIERINREVLCYGTYVSLSYFAEYKRENQMFLDRKNSVKIKDLVTYQVRLNDFVVFGMILDVKVRVKKQTGQQYAKLKIFDETGLLEVTMSANEYAKHLGLSVGDVGLFKWNKDGYTRGFLESFEGHKWNYGGC